jgi:cyclopropane fatty-acyl-phospholipid synthase-like methyltransferase
LQHNNDIYDERYRTFVSPITKHILERYKINSNGLDYGAGTGPVISTILNENGYGINKYDPYFSPDVTVLEKEYDYIVCCEVIEHFYHPKKEFIKLKNLLKNNGELICKTDLYDENIDFSKWKYKNDPTHVFFYSRDTFEWIKQNIGFNKVSIEGRVVIFEK